MKQTTHTILLLLVFITGLSFLYGCANPGESEKQEKKVMTNPFSGDVSVIQEGEKTFMKHCEVCHGVGGIGDVCPDLTDNQWIYGSADPDLFTSISEGRPNGMPRWGNFLDEQDIWKIVSYISGLEPQTK